MSQTHRTAAFSPRREATVPARSVAKAQPSQACPSCGREAGCNCHAAEDDAQEAAWKEQDMLDRQDRMWAGKDAHDSFCPTCGREAGCNCRSSADESLLSQCEYCGEVSDEACRCPEAEEDRAAEAAFYGE